MGHCRGSFVHYGMPDLPTSIHIGGKPFPAYRLIPLMGAAERSRGGADAHRLSVSIEVTLRRRDRILT
jgi:hypothetical protein